jgi:NitT/TauT family transport system permease protein
VIKASQHPHAPHQPYTLRQPAFAGGLAILAGIAALLLVDNYPTIALLLTAIAAIAGFTALTTLANDDGPAAVVLTPALFALLVLFMWESLTRGFAVPMILLPPPSAIGAAFWDALPDLVQDVEQTVLFAAIPGFLAGTALGFAAAIAVDRSPFLQQGLLPLSNFASVIPIVGVAPIMIMWFGFDWQSKAAVVVLITFFPAFVNMIAGLQQASNIERDLMASYAATYRQTMWKLRLPAALPFLFAALKINASLSLIGAIVAEFFGTPVHGIGFRISVEIGHLALDHVWAAILVAALVGSLSYAVLALAESAATFWHPSQLTGRTRPKP